MARAREACFEAEQQLADLNTRVQRQQREATAQQKGLGEEMTRLDQLRDQATELLEASPDVSYRGGQLTENWLGQARKLIDEGKTLLEQLEKQLSGREVENELRQAFNRLKKAEKAAAEDFKPSLEERMVDKLEEVVAGHRSVNSEWRRHQTIRLGLTIGLYHQQKAIGLAVLEDRWGILSAQPPTICRGSR